MSLKVELKPGERFILGDSVITNDNQRTRLFIQGDAPILREKDILTPETADTPARRIYLAVQLMYLSRSPEQLHAHYFRLVDELVAAAPSTLAYVDRIGSLLLTGETYKALKEARALIAYEEELVGHAQPGGAGLRADRAGDDRPA